MTANKYSVYLRIISNIFYLFPRAHCSSLLLAYAILAYYMKKDSRSFSRLVYKK